MEQIKSCFKKMDENRMHFLDNSSLVKYTKMEVNGDSVEIDQMKRPRQDSQTTNDSAVIKDLMNLSTVAGNPNSRNYELYADGVKSLIRHLRRSQERGSVENLVRAIKHQDPDTACVRRMKTLDGRMQIKQRKVVPNVFYYNIFVNAEIKSHHELLPLPHCHKPYDTAQTGVEICVNPYHYEVRGAKIPAALNYPQRPHHRHQFPDSVLQETLMYDENANDGNYRVTTARYNEAYTHREADEFLVIDRDIRSVGTTNGDIQRQMESCNLEVKPWMCINYFEQKEKIGDQFSGSASEIDVNCGYGQSEDGKRFCLGQLSKANREQKTINVRDHIGKGIKISGGSKQDCIIENLTEQAIFIQSPNLNHELKRNKNHVIKVPSGAKVLIYNFMNFSLRLQEHSVNAGYKEVTKMADECTIRMSFVKGWGEGYKLQRVTETPVSLEITMLFGLQCLDRVWCPMKPDGSPPSSFS